MMSSRNIKTRQNESTIVFIIIHIIVYERNVSRMVRWQDKKINAMKYAVTLQLTRAFCTGWSILSPHAEKRFDNEKMWYPWGLEIWCLLGLMRSCYISAKKTEFLSEDAVNVSTVEGDATKCCNQVDY